MKPRGNSLDGATANDTAILVYSAMKVAVAAHAPPIVIHALASACLRLRHQWPDGAINEDARSLTIAALQSASETGQPSEALDDLLSALRAMDGSCAADDR